MDYNQKLSEYKSYFENQLNNFLDEYLEEDNALSSVVSYSIIDAGKRIRPILCFAVSEMLGGSVETVRAYALAIEMIHSYSLVHDDLPCMDDDDYRRGKLSTHKKFGEGLGVLAGDALLNLAFEVVLNSDNLSISDLDALKILAESSGIKGMIKGQVLDLKSNITVQPSEKLLNEIAYNKTAKLIMAPILIASILNGKKNYEKLKQFGYNLGVLFQVIDDIMDFESDFTTMGKTPGKDVKTNKLTSVTLLSLNQAKVNAQKFYDECIKILKTIPNSEFLINFTDFLYNRRS